MTEELFVYRYARKRSTPSGDPCDGSLARIVPRGEEPPRVVEDYCDACVSIVEMDRGDPVVLTVGTGDPVQVLAGLHIGAPA